MNKVRWGIFGTGFMAHRFATDLPLSKTGQLVAVASRDPSKAEAFAPNIQAMPSYEALAKSDLVDAIYVATPNNTHKDQCLLALRHGKAVLCEKPIVTRPEDLREIIATAEQAGVVCMEGLWTSFLPGFVTTHNRIANGDIGQPVQAHMSLGFPRLEVAGDPITDPSLGGGALLDLGVYCVGLLNRLLGPAELVAHHTDTSKSGSVRNCTAMLLHKPVQGPSVYSTFTTSHDSLLPNRLEISGTRGRFVIDSPIIQAQSIKFEAFETQAYINTKSPSKWLSRAKSSNLWPKFRQLGRALIGSPGVAIKCDYPGSGFQFQIDEIAHCLSLNTVQSSIVSLESSLNGLILLDKMSKH